jgi:hypothetical protein
MASHNSAETAKQSEAKFKYIFSLFSLFSLFFRFFGFFHFYFCFFSLTFHFASIFSLNFRLFYLRFRFRFLVFRIEVNHVKSGFFFASKRNEIFASISNFASEAKVRAHPMFSTTSRVQSFQQSSYWGEKLWELEVPTTLPLTYAEVAAKPATALMETSHMYIRCGGAIPPLAPLYTGPYKVLACQAKF